MLKRHVLALHARRIKERWGDADVSEENIKILALSVLHNRKSWRVPDLQSLLSPFCTELQAYQFGFSKAPENCILQQQNTEAV